MREQIPYFVTIFSNCKQKLLTILLLLRYLLTLVAAFSPGTLQAAYSEVHNFNTLPLKVLSPLKGDNAQQLQDTINKVAALANGGRILLKKGHYQLSGVTLKSNVHILIEKDTLLEPFTIRKQKKLDFFLAGIEVGKEVKNISVRGVGGRFKINLPKAYTLKTRAFHFGNVNNVLVENFDMEDNYTLFSAVAFGLQRKAKSPQGRAKNVTVRNISLAKSHYGYGLIQANAGENMLFENLVSKGAGVTVRLETDLLDNNKFNIGIDNIRIKNATCIDGHTALFMQPHSIENGVVKADEITSIRCGVGIFVQRNIGRFEGLQNGSFAFGSYVKGIQTTFGESPISEAKKNQFYPPKFYKTLKKPSDVGMSTHFLGPSIAPVVNMLPQQVVIEEKEITIQGTETSVQNTKIVTTILKKGRKARDTR